MCTVNNIPRKGYVSHSCCTTIAHLKKMMDLSVQNLWFLNDYQVLHTSGMNRFFENLEPTSKF